MRENEIDGKDYHFLSKEKFEHKEKFGEFIECEWVHGNRYGTPVQPLEDALSNGDAFLLDVDVKGAMNLIEEFEEDCLSIFIEPPGMNIQEKLESLNERLLKRGGSNETLIKQKEGHGFASVDNREESLERLLSFFEKNIGARSGI